MADTKICKICNLEKNIDNFYFIKNRNSFRNKCKDCLIEIAKAYYQNNKEKIIKRKKKFYAENSLKIREESKSYYYDNKDKVLEKSKDWRTNNKDKIKEISKNYYIENKEKIRDNQKDYRSSDAGIRVIRALFSKKYKEKPNFKLRNNISLSIRRALQNAYGSKNGFSFMKYVDWKSIDQLQNHLEAQFISWMNWDNWGPYDPEIWDDNDSSTWTWQLDHIIPQSDLPYNSMEHPNFKKCWALENLRPYSAKQNIIDGSSKIRHKSKETSK